MMPAKQNDWCSFLNLLIYRYIVNNRKIFDDTSQKKVAVYFKNEDIRKELLGWLHGFFTNNPKIVKSSKTSQELRHQGNEKFKKGDDEASLKFYTESIIHAPHTSPELPLAHGNRSAVLFRLNEYEKCIEDIDSATQNLEKGALYIKLMTRKGKALLKLKRKTESKNCFDLLKKVISDSDLLEKEKDKLLEEIPFNTDPATDVKDIENITEQKNSCPSVSKKKNGTIPFTSCLLELEKNKTSSSRRVTASQDIEIGDTLIVETPFSFVILPDHSKSHCQYCCCQLRFPVACYECVDYLFCNDRCRAAAFELFHKWECPGVLLMRQLGVGHLALKTTLVAAKKPQSTAYGRVNDLVSHLEDVPSLDLAQYALTATLLILYLENYTNYFITTGSENLIEETGFVILKHQIQVICNAFAVKKLVSVSSDFASLNFSTVTYATGFYPSAALLNHSCDPNIITSFFNNVLIVRARKKIRKGEEIFNCYGPDYRRMQTLERKEILKNQFFFDCQCKRCVQWENCDEFNLYLCSKCHSPLSLKEAVESAVKCNKCHEFTEIRFYQNLMQKYNVLREKGEQLISSANAHEACQTFRTCKDLLSSFMDGNNAELVDCTFDYAECCFAIGDYSDWWKYYFQCVRVIKQRFGEFSIEYLETIKRLIENYLLCTPIYDVVESSVVLSFFDEMTKIIELNFGCWSGEYSIVARKKAELANYIRQRVL